MPPEGASVTAPSPPSPSSAAGPAGDPARPIVSVVCRRINLFRSRVERLRRYVFKRLTAGLQRLANTLQALSVGVAAVGRLDDVFVPHPPLHAEVLRACEGDLASLRVAAFTTIPTAQDAATLARLLCPECVEYESHKPGPLEVWNEGGRLRRRVFLVYHGTANWSSAAWTGLHRLQALPTAAGLHALGDRIATHPFRVTGDPFQLLRAHSSDEDLVTTLSTTAHACRLNGAWAFAWGGVLYDCTGSRPEYKYGADLLGHVDEMRHLDAGVLLDGAHFSISLGRMLLAYVILGLCVFAIVWQIVNEDNTGLGGALQAVGNIILLLGLLRFFVADNVRGPKDVARLLLGFARVLQPPLSERQRVCLANYEGLSASTDGAHMSYSDACFMSDLSESSPRIEARALLKAGWIVFDKFALAPSGETFKVKSSAAGVLNITRDPVEPTEGIFYPHTPVGGTSAR